jgi:DNA-binding CsgD family transcriptional regulator
VGFALHTLAVTSPAAEAVPLLREAVAQLDAAGAVDLRARAGLELGALLVKATAEDRTEGVRLLREALDYASTTDVPPVQRRAVRLLVRAGEPVTERGESPIGALTPGERRVVELAAAGDTNRQIAQKLFVTVKAVEWHLSNAYRKLGVSSRAQLPDVLSGEGPSSSSAR